MTNPATTPKMTMTEDGHADLVTDLDRARGLLLELANRVDRHRADLGTMADEIDFDHDLADRVEDLSEAEAVRQAIGKLGDALSQIYREQKSALRAARGAIETPATGS